MSSDEVIKESANGESSAVFLIQSAGLSYSQGQFMV